MNDEMLGEWCTWYDMWCNEIEDEITSEDFDYEYCDRLCCEGCPHYGSRNLDID